MEAKAFRSFKTGIFVAQKNFIMLLTHRRGGLVLGVSENSVISEDTLADDLLRELLDDARVESWQTAIASQIVRLQNSQPTRSEPFPLWIKPGFVVAMSPSTTAEYLSNMYSRVLLELGITDAEVENLCVTAGPGSFTGLRIGCAFANGLARGRSRPLWGLTCVSLDKIRNACIKLGLYEDWKQNFEVIERGQDESFAPVGFLDAIACVGSLGSSETTLDEVLYPRYGKEPGPVIKLREQQAQERENANG